METSIDTVAKAQGLIERDPNSFVAAFFAIAFCAVLLLIMRRENTHREELRRLHEKQNEEKALLYKEFAERMVTAQMLVVDFVSMAEDVHEMTLDVRQTREAREARERRKSQTNLPAVALADTLERKP